MPPFVPFIEILKKNLKVFLSFLTCIGSQEDMLVGKQKKRQTDIIKVCISVTTLFYNFLEVPIILHSILPPRFITVILRQDLDSEQ